MTITNLVNTNPGERNDPNRVPVQQPAPEAQHDTRPAEGAPEEKPIPEQKPVQEVEQDTRPAEGAQESRTPEQQPLPQPEPDTRPAVHVDVNVDAKPAKGGGKGDK